jgi:lactoylglutathione lyase
MTLQKEAIMLHLSSTYILVNDIDRSAEFYSKLFEVKPTVITPERWVQFDFDGNSLAICNQMYDLKAIAGGGDLESVYSKAFISRLIKHKTIFGNNVIHKLRTEDLNKEHSRISAINIGIVSDILYANISLPYSFFTVTDPDGNVIEIYGEFAAPKQQEIASKDKKIVVEAPVIEKPAVVEPVIEKPAAAEPIPEQPAAVEPIPEQPAPVEIIPEKPVISEPEIEKPEVAPPPIEKSFKDKSILKAAIEKEKETKAEKEASELKEKETAGLTGDEPVFISPNWEEIANRLKKTVIEKTSRPGSSVKEKEPGPVKQADAEPAKKAVDRPGLRPIIAEEKPMILEEQMDDEPAVMTPIWEESYSKVKRPAIEKPSSPPAVKEPDRKPDKVIEETPNHKSSATDEQPIESTPLKTEEPVVLPPIVVKNIRNAVPVKEPESKPEKHPAEKPIFKPLAKDKEKEKEKEIEKEKEKDAKPAKEEDKPMPPQPPIWEKPSQDLWGDNRK